MNQFEAIDEAVNLLMDYHLRPHFLIEDDNQDLDDDIYSYVHTHKYESWSKVQNKHLENSNT